jgi:hypothetical protein
LNCLFISFDLVGVLESNTQLVFKDKSDKLVG